MNDMHTPLGRVRGLGSAKIGTAHFWAQRLTALANVPLALFFIALLLALTGADYQSVRAALASPLVAVPTLLLVLSGAWHMRIGMQTVIEDYIHGSGAKLGLLIGNSIFSSAVALASIYAVLKIGFSS